MKDSGVWTLLLGLVAIIAGVTIIDWRAGLIVAGVLFALGGLFSDADDEAK